MRTDATDTRSGDAAGAGAAGAASRAVAFTFRLDDGQRLRAVRVLVRVTYLGAAGVTLGIVLLAALLFALRKLAVRGPDPLSIGVIACSALLLAAPFHAAWRARRQVRASGQRARTVEGDLGPHGIALRAGDDEVETLGWSRVRAVAPIREGLLIRLREPPQAILLPRDAFSRADAVYDAATIAREGIRRALDDQAGRTCIRCGYVLQPVPGSAPARCPECGLDAAISRAMQRARPERPWEAPIAGAYIGVMLAAGIALYRMWLGWGVEPPGSWGYPLLIAAGLTAGSIACGALSGRFLQSMPRLAAHAFAAPLVLVCIAGGVPVSLREGEAVSALYFAVLAVMLIAAAATGLRIGRRQRLAARIAVLSRPARPVTSPRRRW